MKAVHAFVVLLMVPMGLFAVEKSVDQDLSEEDVARLKAIEHKRITGESTVGYKKTLRTSFMALGATSATGGMIRNLRAEQDEITRKVKIRYDLEADRQCNVRCEILDDGRYLSASRFTGACGDYQQPGTSKEIIWDAESDWPNNFSERMKVRLTAEETDILRNWATITIAWADWGGRDIDICGYWLNQKNVQVGYAHGSGSNGTNVGGYGSAWRGDNTGSGPEYVLVGLAENIPNASYRIHFNHYGTAPSNPHVRVTVSGNGRTIEKTCRAETRSGHAASTDDPPVTIEFDNKGTPLRFL